MKSVTKHGYGVAVFKATITDGQGGSSTGYGSEKASDFGDFLEKAETKAVGRALAMLGFGTQFAPKISKGEEERIVDAPVSRGSQKTDEENNQEPEHNRQENQRRQEPAPDSPITTNQIAAIKQLCQKLEKDLPAELETYNFLQAKQSINQLTAEYRSRKK